ncbi:MAG: hypothetical protein R3E89_18515 [Thiolinea sp.]
MEAWIVPSCQSAGPRCRSVHYLSVSDGNGNERRELALHKPEWVWRGTLWGMQPHLELNDRNSLVIYSQNTGIGHRKPGTRKLTVAYRNNRFCGGGFYL